MAGDKYFCTLWNTGGSARTKNVVLIVQTTLAKSIIEQKYWQRGTKRALTSTGSDSLVGFDLVSRARLQTVPDLDLSRCKMNAKTRTDFFSIMLKLAVKTT
jgi:hypothetical protein